MPETLLNIRRRLSDFNVIKLEAQPGQSSNPDQSIVSSIELMNRESDKSVEGFKTLDADTDMDKLKSEERLDSFSDMEGEVVDTTLLLNRVGREGLRSDHGSFSDSMDLEPRSSRSKPHPPFNLFAYFTFLLIGISYLWPWNCMLSATPYFFERLYSNEFMRNSFNSWIMTSSTVASTFGHLYLTHKQHHANYFQRVIYGEIVIGLIFVFMGLSCVVFTDIPLPIYFVFIMFASFSSTLGTCLAQNGSFAVVHSFGPVYTQAIMVGQAVSGVLPAIASMISSWSSADPPTAFSSSSDSHTINPFNTMIYFLTSTVISFITLILFLFVMKQQQPNDPETLQKSIDYQQAFEQESDEEFDIDYEENPQPFQPIDEDDAIFQHIPQKKHVPLPVLMKKLLIPSLSIFIVFSTTLIYPVFASNILSVNDSPSSSKLFTNNVFVPLAFLCWNLGDLSGRLICASKFFVVSKPWLMLGYALARILFIPIFFLFNIRDERAIIPSDAVYLLTLYLFGVSNGQLSSSAMMSTGRYVEENEKEAAAGFMTFSLSVGLATGSILSFAFVAMVK